jgi:hypothetical protein
MPTLSNYTHFQAETAQTRPNNMPAQITLPHLRMIKV